jgi:hypothetical protein
VPTVTVTAGGCGAIPLEAMDLMVNPVSQEVAGIHGDQIIHKIK